MSKEVSSTIFKVFGITQPGIEPRSPRPLVNTLPTSSMLYFAFKSVTCLGTKSKYYFLTKRIFFTILKMNFFKNSPMNSSYLIIKMFYFSINISFILVPVVFLWDFNIILWLPTNIIDPSHSLKKKEKKRCKFKSCQKLFFLSALVADSDRRTV